MDKKSLALELVISAINNAKPAIQAVQANLTSLGDALKNANQVATGFGDSLKKNLGDAATSAAPGLSGTLVNGLNFVTVAAAGATAAVAVLGTGLLKAASSAGSFMSSAMMAFSDTQKASNQLAAVWRSMGREIPTAEIRAYATELSRMSGMSVSDILFGTRNLATFPILDEQMKGAMATMIDLAAFMGGDMIGAANKLGKASMGMVGELQESGITISETAKRTKEFGAILKDINEQVAGQAAAALDTYEGRLKQLQSAWKGFEKVAGEGFWKAARGFYEPVIQKVYELVDAMKTAAKAGDFDPLIDLLKDFADNARDLVLWVLNLARGLGESARNPSVISFFKHVGSRVKDAALQFKTGIDYVVAFGSALAKIFSFFVPKKLLTSLGVDWKAVETASKQGSKYFTDAVEKVEKKAKEAQKFEVDTDTIQKKYALLIDLARKAYDERRKLADQELAQERIRIAERHQSEIRAQQDILAAELQAANRKIAIANAEHDEMQRLREQQFAEQMAILAEQMKTEDKTKKAEVQKKMRELELENAKAAADDARKLTETIDQEIQKQLQKREELAKKIQDLNAQQRDAERQTSDGLRQANQAAMSEYAKLQDQLEAARGKLQEATSLMPTFPEKALQLARDAQSSFAGLAQNLDQLRQNMATNAQLVAQAQFKIATSGLTGVAKWKAELTEVRALILQAQAAAAEGRTKEAESLYKQVISQAQSLATSAPEGMRAAARDQAMQLITQAGAELRQVNEQSISQAENVNAEVATKIQEAGDLIKTEIQRQVEATQANIEALNKNTEALQQSRAEAAKKVATAETAAREAAAAAGSPETKQAGATGETADERKRGEEAMRHDRERLGIETPGQTTAPGTATLNMMTAEERKRGEDAMRFERERLGIETPGQTTAMGAGPLQPGAYTGDQGDRLSGALREEIPGGLSAGSRMLEVMSATTGLPGLGPTMKQAIDSVFDSIQQSLQNAGDVMAGALEIVEPGMKTAMAGAAAGGGEAGFYDTTKAPVDVQGLAETVAELKGALRDVQRALKDSTNVRVTVNPSDGWE